MGCCQSTVCGTGRFFSRFAGRYRKRYLRRGLEASQRQMVLGLEAVGLDGRNLLEIGCGVGYLHQELLCRGATRATGVDLSADMLREARVFAGERHVLGRVDYVEGDFVVLAPTLPPADVTLLDKVVCCYPDAYTLIATVTPHTRSYCALTYPRAHLANRIGIAALGVLMTLIRNPFRPYLYEPARVRTWFSDRGFRRVYVATTPIWLTEIYERA